MSLLANSNAIESGGYNIDRSLRFRSSASAYLNRTLGTPTSELVWTISVWVKRGILSNDVKPIICATDGSGAPQESIWYRSGDYIQYYCDSDGTDKGNFSTNAVYRDPSAWYHYVLSRNGTTITLYVNNVSQSVTTTTAIASYGVMNTSGRIQYLGFTGPSSYWNSYFDGYVTEFNFIDGQALTPSSFGETSTETGVWQPKKYTGTYGNNGCYLNFSDNTSATTLAYDKSGNGNNWTANNISTTAGATYDSMTDVPTLTSATAANYCTLNPLDSARTLSNGNLNYAGAASGISKGTIGVSSGKWYWEYVCSGGATYEGIVGIASITDAPTITYVGSSATSYGYLGTNGKKYNNGTSATYGATWVAGDVIGVALDMDGGTLTFYKNNVSQGTAYSSLSGTFVPATGNNSTSDSGYLNFGQRPFNYTPPTGFKALNTFNLPDPTIKKPNQYIDATLYTGNGTSQSVVNAAGFQPDFVWIKLRNQAGDYHNLFDSVRGVYKRIFSNDTNAEDTNTQTLTAFNSNGFSVGNNGNVNTNGINIVGWQWKKGATPGFDIVTYTGNGGTQNISHSLGVAPKMIIVKSRSRSDVGWPVYHINDSATPNNGYMLLNGTGAFEADSQVWNNTAPTSSVFTVGNLAASNASGATYVAYLFAEIAGFSKFGSYTGNGSADGPFVFTNFQPKYLLVKLSSTAGYNWCVVDAARNTYNIVDNQLTPNTSNAEFAGSPVDFLSNGFKVRTTADAYNNNGGTIIYAAFASNPFKFSTAR